MEHFQLIYGHEVARIKKDGKVKLPLEFFKIVMKNTQRPELVVRLSKDQSCVEASDVNLDAQIFDMLGPSGETSAMGNEDYRVGDRARCRFGLSQKIPLGLDDSFSIPQFMRDKADLVDHVVFLATGFGFEIWNPQRLMVHEATSPDLQTMVQHLIDIGDLPRSCEASPEAAGADETHDNRVNPDPLTDAEPPHRFIEDTPDPASAVVDIDYKDEGCFPPSASQDGAHCGIALAYNWMFSMPPRHAKLIRYATPILTLGNSQWIVVVEAAKPARAGLKGIVPMWRWVGSGEESDLITKFPDDWRDMEAWPGFDPSDQKNLGLPAELNEHYLHHQDAVLGNARQQWKLRWPPFRFRIPQPPLRLPYLPAY